MKFNNHFVTLVTLTLLVGACSKIKQPSIDRIAPVNDQILTNPISATPTPKPTATPTPKPTATPTPKPTATPTPKPTATPTPKPTATPTPKPTATPTPKPTATPTPKPTATPTPTPFAAGKCSNANFAGTSFPVIGTTLGGTSNQVSVSVNGASGGLCGSPYNGASYLNEPCVSVTICSTANPTSCQTINNILLDTGSYGLRIFSSVITVPLTPVTSGGSTLGECVGFGDGSSQWGPVKYAYVQLGNEPKVAVPILTIDSNYQSPPGPCTSAQSRPDTSPSIAGYNGILGVGLLTQDCGTSCVSNQTNGQYFSCGNNNCSCGASVALQAQVTDPVAALPVDNNGVILSLGAISTSGTTSASGTLFLGIDTQSNNSSSGYTKIPASMSSVSFNTKFAAYSSGILTGIIDSGTSVLYIPPASSLPDCSSTDPSYAGFLCPRTFTSLSAINIGSTGSPSITTPFSVGNAYNLYNSGNYVFSNIAASSGSGSNFFDWGLPFFFGKKVFVGNQQNKSGTFWAY